MVNYGLLHCRQRALQPASRGQRLWLNDGAARASRLREHRVGVENARVTWLALPGLTDMLYCFRTHTC